MPPLITYSTDGVPSHRRLQYWNDIAEAATTPLVIDPVDARNFSTRVDLADLGRFRMSEIRSSAVSVRHSKHDAAAARELLFLIGLPLDGACRFRQLGTETLLRTGDFALFDSTFAFDILTDAPHRLLMLEIPHQLLKRSVPCPEGVLGRRMRGNADVGGLVSQFIRRFWSAYRHRLDSAPLPRLTAAILDLVGSAYSLPGERRAVPTTRAMWRVRIREHIEAHLDDADLAPPRVAAALRISTRYLHELFDQGDDTVARHIQTRRLERCADALADPAQRSRSVIEIALSHGFNNHSHFSRVFRARYKATPCDYRRARQDG